MLSCGLDQFFGLITSLKPNSYKLNTERLNACCELKN